MISYTATDKAINLMIKLDLVGPKKGRHRLVSKESCVNSTNNVIRITKSTFPGYIHATQNASSELS